MTEPKWILETARTILLVDWPNPGMPRALLAAGYKVFSFSPRGYSTVELLTDRSPGLDDKDVFPPKGEGEAGYLVFRRLERSPASIDIIEVYRPVAELVRIIIDQALPLRAKVLWLQAPLTMTDAEEANRLATEHGLVCIQGADLAEMAHRLRHLGI
jgi:hypothetical protein